LGIRFAGDDARGLELVDDLRDRLAGETRALGDDAGARAVEVEVAQDVVVHGAQPGAAGGGRRGGDELVLEAREQVAGELADMGMR